jgi:hypothetical protein
MKVESGQGVGAMMALRLDTNGGGLERGSGRGNAACDRRERDGGALDGRGGARRSRCGVGRGLVGDDDGVRVRVRVHGDALRLINNDPPA